MTEADTTVVEQILRISARPETVWRYWTDPARMCEWWGAAIGVKLDQPDRAELEAVPGTGPFGPSGRPMAGYVALPADWPALTAKPWIAKAHRAAATLPAKKPKKPKKEATRT